ncbi:hypothetical protein V7169_26585, partial [Priestia megaterium]
LHAVSYFLLYYMLTEVNFPGVFRRTPLNDRWKEKDIKTACDFACCFHYHPSVTAHKSFNGH